MQDKVTFDDIKPLLECNIDEHNRDEIIQILMSTKVLASKKKKPEKITPDFNLTQIS